MTARATTTSIVVPMYHTAPTLEVLHRRIVAAIPNHLAAEIILVDDGCDQGSGDAIRALQTKDPTVRLIEHGTNRGQHQAIQSGLRASTGETVVVIDADLQDPPEAIPELLQTLDEGPADAVFASKANAYQRPGRIRTGRLFKWMVHRLTGAPIGAGGYVAMSRELVTDVLDQKIGTPYLLARIAATGRPMASVEVERQTRPVGESATTSRARMRLGVGAILALIRLRVTKRSKDMIKRPNLKQHNAVQTAHFDERTLTNPRMVPADTPYVHRHVDRLLSSARLAPGAKILDVGCGLGKFSLPLIDRGYDVTGLDLSPTLIDALRNQLDGRTMPLFVGDILDPPTEFAQSFDAVTGFFMAHHLADLTAAFAGVYSCLRPGGTAVFLEPNAYSPLFPIQITATPAMSWRSDYGVLKMTRRRLRSALEESGFHHIEHRWTGLLPPALANRVDSKTEQRLEKFWPTPALSFQVIAARRPLEQSG